MTPFAFSPVLTAVGFFAGLALGGLYFGALWWSVLKVRNVEHKKRFLLAGWLVRSAALCAGLYAMARADSQVLLCGAVGLLLSRFIIVSAVKRRIDYAKEN